MTGNEQTAMECRGDKQSSQKNYRKTAKQYEKNIVNNIKENPNKFWNYERKNRKENTLADYFISLFSTETSNNNTEIK